MNIRLLSVALTLPLLVLLHLPAVAYGGARNLILMIADGQGFNAVTATDMYNGRRAVYESDLFVKYGVSTYSARNPAGYDPVAMWKDPAYARVRPTDSSAAATALYTGVKTNNGWSSIAPDGGRLETIFERAARAGKVTGTITSVPFSHATPAAAFAHSKDREDYHQVADEMLDSKGVQVIMGGGHPFYGRDGELLSAPDYRYVSQKTWKALQSGKHKGFTLIQAKSDFDKLGQGKPAVRVIGVAQVARTIQYDRNTMEPIASVPSLATMTRGALHLLAAGKKGFLLMIEGGAIDWAAHDNRLDRLIEEQNGFNEAVQVVVDYLDNNSDGNNWGNTLLIVVSDHETGGLWGVFGPYTRFLDRGKGVLPGHSWQSRDHTNALVPLYARGAGSEYFAQLATKSDPELVDGYLLGGRGFNGRYLDNTDVYLVMRRSLTEEKPGQKR